MDLEASSPLTLRQLLLKAYDIPLGDDVEDTEVQHILDTVFLLKGFQRHALPQIDHHLSFEQLIETCQLHLLKCRNEENTLIQGQITGNDGLELHSRMSMNALNSLKTHAWRKLYFTIGCEVMADMLLRYSAFKVTGKVYVQLFGDSLRRPFADPKAQPHSFSLDAWLYKSGTQKSSYNPLPSTKLSFLHTVFKDEYRKLLRASKVPKKLVFFNKLTAKAIENHRKCRYLPIFDQICPEPHEDDNMEKSIKKEKVIRFCSVVFDKVIPIEMYGSRSNKSVILSNLSVIVAGEKGSKLSILSCMANMSLLDIAWLGKSYPGRINKQDHTKRQLLLRQFLEWLFSSFFPRLIASFFHVTHISSSKELLYFRHGSWWAMSKPFVEEYTRNHLQQKKELESITQSESSPTLQCSARVMPKKNNDFRVINIPVRGKDPAEVKDYFSHLTNEIRPAKRIINRLRLERSYFFPVLTSISQVPVQIGILRKQLLAESGNLPPLYFLKFDAKASYDTLPHKKIMEIVESLVIHDTVYTLVEDTHAQLDLFSTLRTARQLKPLNEIKVGGNVRTGNTIMHKSSRCQSLRGVDILEICKAQLERSSTRLRNASYNRKGGVFQGIHLSSLFCDLVYDDLILRKLPMLNEVGTLTLRIADDFLIISPNPALLTKVRKTVTDGIPDYGLQINHLKTAVNFSSQKLPEEHSLLNFCGFEVNVSQLGVVKTYEDPNYNTTYAISPTEAIRKLTGLFKVRSAYNTLSVRYNTEGNILRQVELLASNIAMSYCRCTRSLTVTVTKFAKFIDTLIHGIVLNIGLNGNQTHTKAKRILLQTFSSILSRSNTPNKQYIRYIQEQLDY